ncbi:type III restriction endonuclease subunit R [Rahnella inusitata]|uniref:type III restriction endonuclease subunit R n=1 Tax=Rahnella inusitata TaxID=58169 RepID=UPI0039BDB0F9
MKFNYIKSECGSGKTFALVNKINNDSTNNYIIVQNKIDLLKQTFVSLDNGHLITSADTSNVDSTVMTYLSSPTSQVLGITAKTFFKIDPALLKNYIVYLDDVVNFHAFKAINEVNRKVKGLLKDDIFSTLTPLDETYASTGKQETQGDILRMISNGFEMVDTFDHFVINQKYFDQVQTTIDNVTVSTFNDEVQQLTMLAWIDLGKYKDCNLTFMANKFDESLLYKSNPDMFEESTFNGLRTRTVPTTQRLKVKYFSKSKVLSKSFRMAHREQFDKVVAYINNELKDSEYYYTRNNSETFTMDGKYVPVDTRGMNDLQSYSTCVWMASCRPSPVEAKMTELFFGIDGTDLVRSREYESVEQFVQRGCLRDFDSTDVMTVYVFDEQQAKSLGGDLEYIDLGLDDIESGTAGRPASDIPLKIRKAFSMWLGRNSESTDLIAAYRKWKAKAQENNPDIDFSTLDDKIWEKKNDSGKH